MEKWVNSVMTEKGIALLAKLISGTKLSITRAVTGTGYVSPSTLKTQTAVSGEKQTLTFRQISYPEEGKCSLPCRLSNRGLITGYTVMQVGLYATDPDDGEILFSITQAESGGGTDVPSESESPGYIAEWDFYFQFGQADSVELVVSPADTVTIAMFDDALTQKADKTLGNVDNATFAVKTIQASKDLVFTTEGTGEAYTVEVPGVTELYRGLTFTIVPHEVSTTTMPTLNVNGLGAKPLRQHLSTGSGMAVAGSIDSWLAYAHPVSVTYNGMMWIANLFRPSATYLYGDVPVENGGTGASDAETARENLGITALLGDIANLYVWGKYTGDPSLYSVTDQINIEIYNGTFGIVTAEIKYSDTFVCEDATVKLVDPKSLVFAYSAEANALLGKYIEVSGKVYLVPSTAQITQSDGQTGTINIDVAKLTYATASKLSYVSSWESDTYPANGIDGTYWYTYRKQLGD